MAKLPRKTQKIFCGNPTSENQTSVFGTMKTDNKQYSTDVGTLQSNAAYEQGWKSATIASYKPFMEDFNTLNYINTSQLAYLFQQGIPEWDSATTYYKNSFCSYNGDLWKSLIDNNLNNAPFEGNEWTLFTSGNKGGGLELCDIGTALYVDETQGKRRILNGSIVDINNNTQAWLNRLLQIYAAAPDYFTDEATWQSEATLNIDGCVYKYVLNYDSTGTNVVSVRLPKFPDYVELNDSHISSTVSIAGNGKPLRLTNGSTVGYLCGQYYNNGNNGSQYFSTAAPSLGSTASATYVAGQTGVVTDASTSGLTGKINATTSQTKLKLRYFTQIATGSETENNIVNDIELNNPYTLFDSKYVEAPLYNVSWLKSDGEYKPKAKYPKAYEALVVEQNSSITAGTTVDLPSGTKYTKRGLPVKLSTASDITDYDFVINATDETFRLPLKNGQEGVFANGVKGNGLTMGLTNGTNTGAPVCLGSGASDNAGSFMRATKNAEGQAVGTKVSTSTSNSLGSSGDLIGLTTDASKSGMVVDTTVPSGYNLYYYVGETVQNANLIDAGRIGEILPTKTDAVQAAHASMPSNRYIDLTIGASDTAYTAPADGWVSLNCQTSITRANSSVRYIYLHVNKANESNSYRVIEWFENSYTNLEFGDVLPVSKGDTFQVGYSDGATLSVGSWEHGLRFYYAEGAPSQ